MDTLKRQDKNKKIKEFIIINIGIFLVALSIHAFKNPNQFAFGGVSGFSLVISSFFPDLPIGSLMFILNMVILVLGFIVLGKDVGSKSVYGSFALSGMVWLMEIFIPIDAPLTDQKFLELMYSVLLPGVGSALVFSYGATTGGTDIIAKIISKYFKTRLSISLLVTDFLIAFAAGWVFGIEALLFSIFGVLLKAFVLDSFMENLQIFKIMVIVSKHSKEISGFICDNLNRGATVHKATGAFSGDDIEVITTILSRKQAAALQQYLRESDPEAFITITNSSKIIGNGFSRIE